MIVLDVPRHVRIRVSHRLRSDTSAIVLTVEFAEPLDYDARSAIEYLCAQDWFEAPFKKGLVIDIYAPEWLVNRQVTWIMEVPGVDETISSHISTLIVRINAMTGVIAVSLSPSDE